MNRVAEVNAYLRSLGRSERLRRGKGYYYWTPVECGWRSMMINRAEALPLADWKEEVDHNVQSETR